MRVADALLDGGDELLGDHAADDARSRTRSPAPGSQGSSSIQTWPYIPWPPVCLTYLPSCWTFFGDRLAVGDLGRAHVALDLELALEAVDDDLEVELAHAGDDRLTGLLVGVGAEGRILVLQLLERLAELGLVGLGAWARSPPR